MKKIFVLLMAVMLLLISCGDDSSTNSSDVNYPEEVTESMEQMQTVAKGMMDTKSAQALMFLGNNLNINFAKDAQPLVDLVKKYAQAGSKEYLNPQDFLKIDTRGDYKFPFKELCGTYKFNAETGEWDVQMGGNAIVLKFPADPNNTNVNNAVFTFSEYEDTLIEVEYEGETNSVWAPTRAYADLKIDGNTEMVVDLTATYVNNYPTKVDLMVSMNPFKKEAHLVTSGAAITLTDNLFQNSTKIYALEIVAKFTDYFQTLTSLKVVFEFDKFKIEFEFDVNGVMNDMEGVTPGDLEAMTEVYNKNFESKVYYDGSLAGKIVFRFETFDTDDGSEEMIIPYIVFDDGTEYALVELVQGIMEFLEMFDGIY